MPVSQSTWLEQHGEGRPGQVAKKSTYDADSVVVATGQTINFGRVCRRTNAGMAREGIAAGQYLGVSVIDPTRDQLGDAEDHYVDGSHASIAYRGDIYVVNGGGGAVSIGDAVAAQTDDGNLFSSSRLRGAWADSTAYAVGDRVTHSSANYICIRAHTSSNADDAEGNPARASQTVWEARAYGIVLPGARFISLSRASGAEISGQTAGEALAIVRLSGIQYQTGAI